MPTELEAVAAEAAGCTRCRLHQSRTQVVFGQGDPHADLMFVGEAPGFHEDRQGIPFVGPSGQLLNRLLEGIGLRRQDVYICERQQVPSIQRHGAAGDGSWERVDAGPIALDGTSCRSTQWTLVARVTGWYVSARRTACLSPHLSFGKHAGADR